MINVFDYKDGDIFWKSSGLRAGTDKGNGYRMVCLNRRKLLVHRVIWEMHNGTIPDGMEVDHMDGNRSNNRIENLRIVSRSINNRNRAMQSNNTSGYTGVVWIRSRQKWGARVKVNGKQISLGCFDSIERAVKARDDFVASIGGFTERHGKQHK